MSVRNEHTRSSRSNHSSAYDDESVLSQITAASDLGSKPDFTLWASLVGLDPDIQSEIPSNAAFQVIRDIQNLSNRFPTWLTDPDSAQFKHIPETYHPLINDLCSTLLAAKNLDPGRFHEDDFWLYCAISIILQACHHNMMLGRHDIDPSERDMRFMIDCLLDDFCSSAEDRVVRYSINQDLKLPQARFGKYNVTNTKAGGSMLVEVTNFEPYRANPETQIVATELGPEIPRHLQVVHCVVGFQGQSSGKNRAMMGLVSAIHQKRALGVPEQFTFGVFQRQVHFLQVFAGAWQAGESKIKLYDIGTYLLSNPVDAIRFYLVFRAIEQLAGVYLEQLRQSEQELMSRVTANLPVVDWTPFGMENVLGAPSEPGAAHGTALELLPAFEQRDTYNRVLSYLESISDSSTFLPVDLPPTPPIE
ncbi:unnamed protein product [Rhizoctonia solani]|uniref:Uncharacterized protein n=1 Tax=Rhizoctonia solani TaxID=456999 RepID=A0A8H3DS10_9AGAM|nr:unnamed protein product [Rhizoctonia solani]